MYGVSVCTYFADSTVLFFRVYDFVLIQHSGDRPVSCAGTLFFRKEKVCMALLWLLYRDYILCSLCHTVSRMELGLYDLSDRSYTRIFLSGLFLTFIRTQYQKAFFLRSGDDVCVCGNEGFVGTLQAHLYRA